MAVHSIDAEDDQFAYRYDTQLLIERRDQDLDEDEISDYITEHFEGNSLIAAGDEDLVKIHFHTNEPWKILEYCNSIGEIFDIVVEDMIRQANGQQGSLSEIPCCVNVNMRYLTRFFSWEGYNYARKGEGKSYEKIFRCSTV